MLAAPSTGSSVLIISASLAGSTVTVKLAETAVGSVSGSTVRG